MAWTQQAHDAFTDAFGTALGSHTPDQGSDWTVIVGAMKVGVNNVNAVNADNWALNNTVLANKQAAEMTSLGQAATVGVRMAWDGVNLTGYYFLVGNLGTGIYRSDAGGATLVSSSGGNTAANDVVRLEANGTSLTAYINGVSSFTATDSTYSSGKTAIYGHGTDTDFADDFFAYDDSGGGTKAPPPIHRSMRFFRRPW